MCTVRLSMHYANVHIIECADGKKASRYRENAGRRVSWDLRLVVCWLLICPFHHHPQPLSASTTIGQLPPWTFMTDCVSGVPVDEVCSTPAAGGICTPAPPAEASAIRASVCWLLPCPATGLWVEEMSRKRKKGESSTETHPGPSLACV